MESYEVRLATPDDEDNIFELLTMMHSENGVFVMDDDKVRDIIRNATNGNGGIIGVIEGDKRLEAVICLAIDQYWYTTTYHLIDLFNFVHPDYRKSTRAKSLLSFAKKCSDETKVPLMVGIFSNIRTEAKIKLFERQLPKAGAFFLYNENYARMN